MIAAYYGLFYLQPNLNRVVKTYHVVRKPLVWMAIFFMIVCPHGALAADNAELYIENLTWTEIKAKQDAGINTIIIPTGGTEQNGPHLAIGKHNWIVNYTASAIAAKLKNALVAPVIAYVPEGRINPPDGHMRFVGTVSVGDNTFANLLEDVARSFKQHGFTHICFIGDHGGSQSAQKKVADKLSKEWEEEGVKILHVSDYYAGNGAEDWAKANRLGGMDATAHAGFMDASEVLAINKSAVRFDKFSAFTEGSFDETGAKGSPIGATEVYGRKLLEFKINAAVNQIKRL